MERNDSEYYERDIKTSIDIQQMEEFCSYPPTIAHLLFIFQQTGDEEAAEMVLDAYLQASTLLH